MVPFHIGICVGHVNFMLFVSCFLALDGHGKCALWWNMGSNIQQIISTIMKWLIVRKTSATNGQLQAPTTVRSVVIRVWSTGFRVGSTGDCVGSTRLFG